MIPITIRYVQDEKGQVSNVERVYSGNFWRNYPVKINVDEQKQNISLLFFVDD